MGVLLALGLDEWNTERTITRDLEAEKERLEAEILHNYSELTRFCSIISTRLQSLEAIGTRIEQGETLFLAAVHYMNELRDIGIRFYAYEPGFLHEKVALIDHEFSTAGTPNFDNRSFRLNFEVSALIADRGFSAEMEKMFEDDFAHSVELDPAELEQWSFFRRLTVSLSRLAAPVQSKFPQT